MKIGFEVSNAIGENPTGVGIYIKNFIQSIARLNGDNDLRLLYKADRLKYKKNWYQPQNIPTQTYIGSFYPLLKTFDIIHGLDTYVPNWKSCKKVVTFHDILPLLFKDVSITPPEFRKKKEKDYRKTIELADLIITVSENTKKDLVDYFQIPESKVTSVYPGLDSDFFQPRSKEKIEQARKKYNIGENYLFFAGTISGRKNTKGLVEAFAQSKSKNEHELVLAGSISYMGEQTLDAIKKHNLSDRVKILGYVENEDLPALYSGAKGFVFPTFYEGFGFPILESMLCETPVLASNIGSAPEIGKEFAIYVDANDVDSIAKGIDKLTDNNDFEKTKAREHAKSFSWEHSAKKMLEIYKSIL